MNRTDMERTASISECGTYRYRLGRRWGDGDPVTWVMLNPSTADADVDDPTIRRCIGFAATWGYNAIEVVNLYALRATDPKVLLSHPLPSGLANDRYLVEAAYSPGPTVVAWGAHKGGLAALYRASRMFAAQRAVCLGRTKDGHPRHPLYVKADTKPEAWT